MARQRKRTYFAWLLLSVFVSMMAVSGLHTHQPAADVAADCADCAHHVHHGHLTAGFGHTHECLLCHFLSLPFVPAVVLAVAAPVCRELVVLWGSAVCSSCFTGNRHVGRAPPVF